MVGDRNMEVESGSHQGQTILLSAHRTLAKAPAVAPAYSQHTKRTHVHASKQFKSEFPWHMYSVTDSIFNQRAILTGGTSLRSSEGIGIVMKPNRWTKHCQGSTFGCGHSCTLHSIPSAQYCASGLSPGVRYEDTCS